jgi:hypothetical protein
LWRNDGAGVFSITQTITIPAQMHQPTLSFLNRVVSRCDAFFVQGDAVSVAIQHGASTTTVFTRTVVDYADTGWNLHWVDLSPWRGMSVSLVFQLGSTSCHAFHIDDVAASAWRTPIITGIRPGSSQINTPVTLTVAGGNFISGSTILVNGEALSTTWVNSETLVATAPVGFAFGNYTVDVEQANSGPITTSPYKLLIGRMVFLPTIIAN